MSQNDKLDPELQNAIDQLKQILPRDERATARGRQRFLSEAESLQSSKPAHASTRDNRWESIFRRRKHWRISTVQIALVVMVIAFGSSAATVYAAQDALPNEPLYSLKTWTEDVRVNFVDGPEARADLLLDFSSRRAGEVVAQSEKGVPISESAMVRQQQQLGIALQLAARLDNVGMNRVLMRAQKAIDYQVQVTESTGNQTVSDVLEAQRSVIRNAIENQTAFRQSIGAWMGQVPPFPTVFPTFAATSTVAVPVAPVPVSTIPPVPTVSPLITPLPVPTREVMPTPPSQLMSTIEPPATPQPHSTPILPSLPPTSTVMPGPTDWQTPRALPTFNSTPPADRTPPAFPTIGITPPAEWTPHVQPTSIIQPTPEATSHSIPTSTMPTQPSNWTPPAPRPPPTGIAPPQPKNTPAPPVISTRRP